jgi:hypothetical protein
MKIPRNIRGLLGRTRLAANFVVGRQSMAKEVTPYPDDVWIVSFPKSGNTWTRFLIANLIAGDGVVDWTNIERYVPDAALHRDTQLRGLPRPRYLKSHEPYQPEYRRVVFIVRDPRDVAVSYYHFAKKSKRLAEDQSIVEFVNEFIHGWKDPYGTWGENVGSWLGARRGTKDFLVLRYEDLLTDAQQQLARVAEMLQLPSDDGHLRRAIENSAADRLRALEKAQHDQHIFLKQTRKDVPFVRAAKSGQWKTELPAEACRNIEDAWRPLMRELGYSD